MQWYYSKNGTQLGPIGTEDMKSKLASGEIASSDLVWKDGLADWLPAGQVAELRQEAPSVHAPQVPSATVQPSSPYQAPVASQPSPSVPAGTAIPGAPVSQGFAIASMICGILAVLSCCLWCMSGPLAILAVVFGHVALSKAKSNPARFGGKGMATSGLVTGYLALLLIVLFTLWTRTLTPEKLNNMEFLPKELRDEIRKQTEQQKAGRGVTSPGE